MSATAERTVTYEPRGAARELFYRREPEVLIAGPSGTGKSRACLEKLFTAALTYPGMRGLIARKTRESLTQSAMVTFETKVLPPLTLGLGLPVHFHVEKQEYRFTNGSVIVVGGLDRPSRIMSTEYDMAYVQEATELTENDWESITTRLRNDVMPYQQIIADCNPAQPTHWLKRRADDGRVVMLASAHKDNPGLWDGERWTEMGASYLSKLEALSGVRRLRLLEGRWAAAEGLIYEGWDPEVHLIDSLAQLGYTFAGNTVLDPLGIPTDWPRYWAIDFGYTNPFVWQAWFADPDGRLVRYQEVYRTQVLVEDHARAIKQMTKGQPAPQAIICDHDREDRMTFERHIGYGTQNAHKAVSAGIQAVQARLRPAGDGRPRLVLVRGVTEVDRSLAEAGKPTSTEAEFDGYVWAKTSDGKPNKEAPEKVDDHGMDAARYLVAHVDLVGAGSISYGGDLFG